MNTYGSLTRDLKDMKLDGTGTVLVHTSMKAIGETLGGPDVVLDALTGYWSDGLFCMPALTWNLTGMDEPVFDVLRTPSIVGLLPERFRRREGVYRTWHPTHSLCAIGRDAAAFTAGDEKCDTPCGMGSAWHRLLERDARILLVGCTLTSCTFIHGVEEWRGVSGRLDPEKRFHIVPPQGNVFEMRCKTHHGSPSEQYWRAESALVESGALRFGMLGNARVYILRAKKLYDTVSELLRRNERLFDE